MTWRWRTRLTDLLTVVLGVAIVARFAAAVEVSPLVDFFLVVFVLLAIQIWFNVTTLVVGPKGLTISYGPLTLWGPERLEREEIAGLRVKEQRINWLLQYTLVADVHRGGRLKEVEVFARTPRGAVVRHLEARIRRALLGRA